MQDHRNDPDTYWISSQKINMSHDLRLLNEVKEETKRVNTYQYVTDDMQRLLTILKYDTRYGTPEITTSGLPN